MSSVYHKVNLDNQIDALKKKSTDKLKYYNDIIILCRGILFSQKEKIVSKGFKSIKEEIYFFKVEKQEPLYNLIYHLELKSFELQFPKSRKKIQEKYIQRKLDKLNRFFTYNLDFIQYINSDESYLDKHYFTRKYLDFSKMNHTKFYNIDSDFNTSHDLLLAKIKAYQKLVDYLEERLHKLSNPNSKKLVLSNLKWTSSKVALIELIYALYHGGAINNGNTDIIEIAKALQQTFNFPMNDVYRTYSEIRSRKNRRAKFLDELSCSLITGMDAMDE